jgi:hypothetical protein
MINDEKYENIMLLKALLLKWMMKRVHYTTEMEEQSALADALEYLTRIGYIYDQTTSSQTR